MKGRPLQKSQARRANAAHQALSYVVYYFEISSGTLFRKQLYKKGKIEQKKNQKGDKFFKVSFSVLHIYLNGIQNSSASTKGGVVSCSMSMSNKDPKYTKHARPGL